MPIVLVSVDSKNDKLEEFKALNRHVDLLLESEDPRCRVLSDSIGNFTQRLVIDKLNEGSESFQAVLNMVRSLSISTALIISHHSVFNGWKERTIEDEWEVLEN
jgi:hypothetical protein